MRTYIVYKRSSQALEETTVWWNMKVSRGLATFTTRMNTEDWSLVDAFKLRVVRRL